MGPYKHIIWDWNGALLDDAWLCVEILNGLLDRRKMPRVTLAQYQDLFGFPVKQYYQALGFDFSRETFEDISVEYISQYNSRRFECALQSHANEVLETIHRKGIPQSILSAYNQEYLEQIVAHFGLTRFFENITGLDNNYAASKTGLAGDWLAASKKDREALLLVGDTDHDLEVARSIGIACVLFTGGHQAQNRLEACETKVIMDLRQLLGELEIEEG